MNQLPDEEIRRMADELWDANKFEIVKFSRAVIAAHDERLRQQDPVAWLDSAGNYYTYNAVNGCFPVYAAPIPKEPT